LIRKNQYIEGDFLLFNEENETAEEAIKREVLEEVGYNN